MGANGHWYQWNATAGAYVDTGIEAGDVFVAVYGTTTYQQVVDAYNAGRVVVVFRSNGLYTYSTIIGNTVYFSIAAGSQNISYLSLSSANVWSGPSNIDLQQLSQKVQTIIGNETNQDRYPSTKAVADFGVLASLFGDFDNLKPVQTIEYDLTKNEWCSLFERANPAGTQASDVREVVACRVTVTGDNMTEPQVLELFVMFPARANTDVFGLMRCMTPDVSASYKYGFYQIRASAPKVIGSGYNWIVDFNPSYANRHLKIEVFKTAATVTFNTAHTKSTATGTYHAVGVAQVANLTRLISNLENSISGSAASASYITGYLPPMLAAFIKTGEAFLSNELGFIGADGKAYGISNTSQPINPDGFVFVCGNNYKINKEIGMEYLRVIVGVSINATNNPNVTLPTLARDAQLFLRCHMSGGQLYSDGVITTAIAPGYTWIALGYMSSATVLQFSTLGKEFFTLDAAGKLTHVNGREIVQPSIPEISTNIATDKASTTKTASPSAVYAEVHPAPGSAQPAGGMLPNVFYNLGTLSGDTTFAFAAAPDANITNEWMFQFTTPATAPVITWPAAITGWLGGVAPVIAGSKTYQVSVVNGLGIIAEF